MRSTSPAELDDVAIEALLHGDPPAAARHIAPFVAGVRAAADGPPPRPTLELARLIAQAPETATGESAAAVPITAARQRRHRRALAGRAAGVAIAVKVGLGPPLVTTNASKYSTRSMSRRVMSSTMPRRLGRLFRNQMCATGEASSI
jgi:hypothetical protein